MAKKPETPPANTPETPVDQSGKRYRAKIKLTVGRQNFARDEELIGVPQGTIDSLVNCGHAEEIPATTVAE